MNKYNIIKKAAKIIYKEPKMCLPKEFDKDTPSIFICNHEKNYGPISFALHFPYKARPWSHSEVVHYDEGLDYVSTSFFQQRLKLGKRLSHFLAKLILRPLIYVINKNNPIPIYHDGIRDRETIKQSVASLQKGENQVIFCPNTNPITIDGKPNPNFDFLKGYLLVVKQASRLGVNPNIYPVSFNKSKNSISIGKPIKVDMQKQWKDEKIRINRYLISEVKLGYMYPDRLIGTKLNTQEYYRCNFESIYN